MNICLRYQSSLCGEKSILSSCNHESYIDFRVKSNKLYCINDFFGASIQSFLQNLSAWQCDNGFFINKFLENIIKRWYLVPISALWELGILFDISFKLIYSKIIELCFDLRRESNENCCVDFCSVKQFHCWNY
jgi:hypothetical protein